VGEDDVVDGVAQAAPASDWPVALEL